MANSPRTGNAPSTVEYRVLTGMNYGPSAKRVEPGDVVTDLPPDDLKWLREQKHVQAVGDEVIEPEPEPVEPPVVDSGDIHDDLEG